MTRSGGQAKPISRASNNNKIAIVGMSCLFPGAPNLASYWMNIVNGVDALRDVTSAEWNPDIFFNENPNSFEQIYCKRGGFITELADFDPLKYGVMPNSIAGSDPDQLLALRVASEALADAGYGGRYDGSRAEVILGRTSAPGAGAMNMIQHGETIQQMLAVIKSLNPNYTHEQLRLIEEGLKTSLRNCSSDTIPAVMPNILAGRIAGRLGFKGKTTILDSACASSLIAIEMAVHDLRSGLCDLALAGGIHVNSFAVFYQMFCGLGALSKQQQIRPFDDKADGTLLGEGLGMVVLKRLEDAIADGDRIYALICGIGSSSDGQGTSMLAPSADGEALALSRAYEMAGVSPKSVELLEAHGTGTPSGDAAEMLAVQKVFGPAEKGSAWCAIGSVKSMIGHCQAASGVAGLIKTALSLYHRVLPPTLHVDTPTSQVDWNKSPCYVNTQTRTWIHAKVPATVPVDKRKDLEAFGSRRRAAVSAFGFGGVNAHAVLEEFDDELESEKPSLLLAWETELCLFRAADQKSLLQQLSIVGNYLLTNAEHPLRDVAYSLANQARKIEAPFRTIAIVALSVADLKDKIALVLECLKSANSLNLADVYYAGSEDISRGKLAFVLPGLGAAYPNMLSDLCLHFPDVRSVFDYVDVLALHSNSEHVPSRKIFPRSDNKISETTASLAAMDSAVVNVLMAEWALYTVLQNLGVRPDALVGCSTGEFAALAMSGCVDILDAAPLFYRLSTTIARSIPKESLANLRSAVVVGDYDEMKHALENIADLYLSAALCPSQTILSGSKAAIAEAIKALTTEGWDPQILPMAIPYHTPLVKDTVDPNNAEVRSLKLRLPTTAAWSCSRVDQYPKDVAAIRQITTDLFSKPILLKKTVEAMYADGVTIFVEVGPKGVLTPLIADTLQDKPHLAVASNTSFGSAITQLNHCLGELAAHGVNMQLDYLFSRRSPEHIDFNQQPKKAKSQAVRLQLNYPQISLSDQVLRQVAAEQPATISSKDEPSVPDPVSHTQTVEPEPDVLQTYLSNMADFHKNLMGMQEEVMRAYLSQQQQAQAETGTNSLPLLRNGLLACDVQETFAAAEVMLNLNDHQYLLDHAIGGDVSVVGGEPERVYLLPLTAALEMMAELSSLLVAGRNVVRITQVRAAKRIRVGREGCKIKVQARALSESIVEASIEIDGPSKSPAMFCHVEFAPQYPASPAVPIINDALRLPILSPAQLYAPTAMFHGPRMQSVLSIESIGKRVATGTLAARIASNWFAGIHEPEFVTDPLLLDNSTQLVLFHLFEHNEDVSALLPFLVESVEFYTQLSILRGKCRVIAILNSVTTRGTEADVVICDEQNKVVAKFTGISSRRIILNDRWKSYIAQPPVAFLSDTLWFIQSAVTQSNLNNAIVQLSQMPEDDSTLTWCLDYVLHTSEREEYLALPNLQRKREWLAGRIAAKEAVRRLLKSTRKLEICSSDVIINIKQNGQPYANGIWVDAVGSQPLLSISHKAGIAVAIAADPHIFHGVGIDVEVVERKEPGFDKLAFLPEEIEQLMQVSEEKRDRLLIQLWSAKEAVGKALGTGLSANPRSLKAQFVKEQDNETLILVSGQKDGPFVVHCQTRDGTVIAVTNLEPAYSNLNS